MTLYLIATVITPLMVLSVGMLVFGIAVWENKRDRAAAVAAQAARDVQKHP
jgi:ATP/ADP translocase